MRPEVQIKGLDGGLIISMSAGTWEEARRELFKHLDERNEFLCGARVALDVGDHAVKAAELGQIRKDISKRDLTLWAILSNSPSTEKAAQDLGLATQVIRKIAEKDESELDTTIYDGERALLVRLLNREPRSANLAKDRLKLVLIHDRTDISPNVIEIIKDDLIDLISHHIEIDPKSVRIRMTQEGRHQSLIADFPLRQVQRRRGN
jgi:cell division topological specificity factor MinE